MRGAPRRKHDSRDVPSRKYLLGLPVVVAVYDDGRVQYLVDTAEASMELNREYPNDEYPDYSEAIVKADIERIDADHEKRMELIHGSD